MKQLLCGQRVWNTSLASAPRIKAAGKVETGKKYRISTNWLGWFFLDPDLFHDAQQVHRRFALRIATLNSSFLI